MKFASPKELREEGFRLLVEGLGTVGAVRFMQQFEAGSGDYTEERAALQDGTTIDEIVARIQARKKTDTKS